MGAVVARGSNGKYTIAFADGTESDQVRCANLTITKQAIGRGLAKRCRRMDTTRLVECKRPVHLRLRSALYHGISPKVCRAEQREDHNAGCASFED